MRGKKSVFVTSLNMAYFIKMLIDGWGLAADLSMPCGTHVIKTWLWFSALKAQILAALGLSGPHRPAVPCVQQELSH